MSQEYNGHKNWQYWNVALWFGNDEGLYNFAIDQKKAYRVDSNPHKLHDCAESILDFLNETGTFKTPDGARYTVETIMAAIDDLE